MRQAACRGSPDASYEARLEVVGQTARKKFGSPESRVIKEMQAQRRNQQAPNPFESEVEEEPSEFERERAEDISSAIDQLRKARAGIPLEEFKLGALGQTSDECAEDCAKQGP